MRKSEIELELLRELLNASQQFFPDCSKCDKAVSPSDRYPIMPPIKVLFWGRGAGGGAAV